MRSRLLCVALTLLICSEAAALAQCDDKSQQNAAMKQASRAILVGHPNARRKLIRRGRRKSSKMRLQRQKIASALMGGLRHLLPLAIVKPSGRNVRNTRRPRRRITLFGDAPRCHTGSATRRTLPLCSI
jgi:hypothetical protein